MTRPPLMRPAPSAVSRATTSVLGRAVVVRVRLAAVLVAGGLACKSSPAEPTAEKSRASEPPRFSFELPKEFRAIELRGEGSESISAPAGATVVATEAGVRVENGADFSLEIRERAPELRELVAKIPSERRRLEQSDLVVFETKGGYAFISTRELVPEWDESDRRRFACGSAGAAADGAETRGFTREAAQDMVAACRTLELPRLE